MPWQEIKNIEQTNLKDKLTQIKQQQNDQKFYQQNKTFTLITLNS